MLPVAGFILPLPPPRARRAGPARSSRTSQAAAPANPDAPRQRHFEDAPPTVSESARMHAPPIPESHAPGATPPGIRSLRGCSQHSRPRHPFADPAPLVRTAQSSSHSNSAPPSSGDCAGAAASFPEASWCCVLEGVRFVSPFVYCCCASLPRFRGRNCP